MNTALSKNKTWKPRDLFLRYAKCKQFSSSLWPLWKHWVFIWASPNFEVVILSEV